MVQSKFLFDVVYSVKYGILWSSIALHSSIHCAFCNIWHCIAWFGGRDLVRVRIRAPGHITGDPSNASGAVVRFPNPPTCFWKQAKRPIAKKCPKNTVTQEHQGLLKQGLSQHVKQHSACLCDIPFIFIFPYSSGLCDIPFLQIIFQYSSIGFKSRA